MRPSSVGVGVVALVTVFGAACASQTRAGDTALAPLRLTDAGTTPGALGLPEQANGRPPTGSPYILRATLPTGTPAPAPVWRLPKPTPADVSRVATAMGLGGAPTAVQGGWVARSGSHLLTVRDDGSWSWGIDCMPGVPIAQESLQVACGSAVATPAQRPGPTAERARELADPVLHVLGWAGGDVAVTPGSPATTVTARRSVGDTKTADWLTMLSFTVGDLLDTANGWVAEPLRGRTYPLVAATTAWRTLQDQPRPMPPLCRVRADGRPGCEPVMPRVVTGVRLGLALRHEPDRALLVPAWLFDVAGDSQPLTVVAVQPQFIAPPTPVPMGAPSAVSVGGPASPKSTTPER